MDNTQANAHDKKKAERSKEVTKVMLRTFWGLLILTAIEFGLGLLHYEADFLSRWLINAFFIACLVVMAFYNVAVLMHLKFERKYLAIIILIPVIFLLWGIGALLWEGGATHKLRMKRRATTEISVPWQGVKHQAR